MGLNGKLRQQLVEDSRSSLSPSTFLRFRMPVVYLGQGCQILN
jgi:hypothetical protein